jgi:hypothetical protein
VIGKMARGLIYLSTQLLFACLFRRAVQEGDYEYLTMVLIGEGIAVAYIVRFLREVWAPDGE